MERLFKEIMTGSSPNFGRDADRTSRNMKLKIPKQAKPKEGFTKKQYMQIIRNQRQKENFESSKKKAAHHI